jgi:hypothetical protein
VLIQILTELATRIECELAQGTLEYVLVLGVVAVALVAALMAGTQMILPQILPLVCPAVDPMGPPSCMTFNS